MPDDAPPRIGCAMSSSISGGKVSICRAR
jgi:hypothetical protein